jgi:hypothetical protein
VAPLPALPAVQLQELLPEPVLQLVALPLAELLPDASSLVYFTTYKKAITNLVFAFLYLYHFYVSSNFS